MVSAEIRGIDGSRKHRMSAMLTTRNPPGLITGQWAAMTSRSNACQSSKPSPASYDLPTKYGGDHTLTATLPPAIRGTSSRASPS